MLERMTSLVGLRVHVAGRLETMTRKEAEALVVRAGGQWADRLDEGVALVVLGRDADRAAIDARLASLRPAAPPDVIDEEQWCQRLGRVGPARLRQQFYPLRTVRSLYPRIGPVRLRYLERCGLLHDVVRTPDDTWYGFAGIGLLRQVDAALEAGESFRGIVRALLARHAGQLALEFHAPRQDTVPARVLALRSRPEQDLPTLFGPAREIERSPAERKFLEASALDVGEEADREAAMAAYREALALDPDLVPAMINLGNLHYLEDHLPEAHALYLQASLVDPACFEAWYNLGNLHHDGGRLEPAAQCYAEALRLRPDHAEAHFYFAVTLEKLGRGEQARPHWRAYQELAPDGEWVELAREFSP